MRICILFLLTISMLFHACLLFAAPKNSLGVPQMHGAEPKEPKAYGDPALRDPFHKPDEEVDEPYIEDRDMTKMELPFKEPEILFDFNVDIDHLERYFDKEPNFEEFEPDLRSKDRYTDDPDYPFFLPDFRGLGRCPKGMTCK